MSSDEDSSSRGREKFMNERTYAESADNIDNVAGLASCRDEDLTQESFGPALPPHLIAKCHAGTSINGEPREKERSEDNVDAGNEERETTGFRPPDDRSNSVESYGPQLPTTTKKIIGPEIPAHLVPCNNSDDNKMDEDDDSDAEYGPSLTLMVDPHGDEAASFRIPHLGQEKRSESSEGIAKRESWMLELPPEGAVNLGLGARKFRTKLCDDKDRDRSGWTDTPETREMKKNKPDPRDDALRIKQKRIRERNQEIERLVKKAEKKKKKRKKKTKEGEEEEEEEEEERKQESLLEIHRRKMEKKARKEAKKLEKSGKPPERRPFDRNIDLQVNRFDESQKRAVIKKAQFLNDRFAQGESKYL